LLEAASAGFAALKKQWPEASVTPSPGLELAEPELRLVPDERRIAEAGWNREVMAQVSRAIGDGLYVGDYFDGEERLDIIVRADAWETPEEMAWQHRGPASCRLANWSMWCARPAPTSYAGLTGVVPCHYALRHPRACHWKRPLPT
jgi:hypothetical protein